MSTHGRESFRLRTPQKCNTFNVFVTRATHQIRIGADLAKRVVLANGCERELYTPSEDEYESSTTSDNEVENCFRTE